MSLSGARGPARISRNPDCELQAAMVADRVNELRFYQSVTGRPYPGEYGERLSARRRGLKFESNLAQNDAALLRKAVGPVFEADPDAMTVRDFDDELPGTTSPNPKQAAAMRAVRRSRTRQVFGDLFAGKPVPDLLIQPQLRLTVGPDSKDFIYVSPDFMVLDRRAGIYVPGEVKSFIVRDGVGDPGDLDPTRRQAGVEILAFREEAERLGIADRVTNRAVFVFSTPYGLIPHEPVQESLDAEIREILRAIEVLQAVKERLAALRSQDGSSLPMLVDELRINYQENCVGTCIMAEECKKRFANKARLLGDTASDLLGEDTDITRVIELLEGAEPVTEREAALKVMLADAASALMYLRRTA